MFRTTSLLFSILLLPCFIMVKDSPAFLQKEETNSSAPTREALQDRLADSLSHLATFQISVQQVNRSSTYSFLNTSLEHMETTTFLSNEPVSGKTHGNSPLRFTLAILTYEDSTAARSAEQNLWASADPDTGLSYAWDHVVSTQTSVYWLHAPCLLSDSNWQRLKTTLVHWLTTDVSPANPSFECQCGRPCTRDQE